MKQLLLMLALVFSSVAYAADQAPTPPPTPPPIVLPDVPPAPNPTPAPTPTTLAADQLYIIRANVPVVVLTSPEGLVKQTTDAGPIKIKAKFTDGTGQIQCRTYTDKTVISLEAAGNGTVEVMVVPVGSTDPASIQRRTLVVGTAPPVPPNPPSPTDPLTTALQAAYSSEKDAPSLAALQATWKTMAATAAGQGLKTNADAAAWMKKQDSLQPTQLAATRKVISAELGSALGTSATTPINVTTFTAELTKISNALSGVK